MLGVEFDCKLDWNIDIAKTISKAKKAIFGLRLIKRYFNQSEMRTLLEPNFYSILQHLNLANP